MKIDRKSISRFVAMLGVVWLSASAKAQQQPVTLTLKDALQYALKNSSDARKAALDIENGNYKIEETRARALPQLSLSSSLTDQYKKQSFVFDSSFIKPGATGAILVPSGTTWNSLSSVNLQQAIYDQSVFTGLKAAKSTQQYYQLAAQLTDEQIIEQVATAYYQVLVQRQNLVVIDSNIKNTTRVHDIINGQYENGLAKKIDVDRTQVTISNLKAQRQQLINAATQQENALKFYMGMEIATPVSIPPSQLDSITPADVPMLDSLDISERTEYKILKKQDELYTYNLAAYKAEYYPTLSLSASHSLNGVSEKFVVFRGEKHQGYWFDYGSASLNLRVPLFNGFATKARVRQANVSLEKNREDIRNTTLSLNLAYENAKTQIHNSLITLDNQKENVQLAQEIFFNTQNNYNNGLAPLTDLLDSENSLTQAQNNYSSALLDYKIAQIQLIKSQGQLKTLIN